MTAAPVSLRLAFNNILFPTDFSSASETALPYLQTLCRYYDSKVFVAHVLPPEPPVFIPMEAGAVELNPEWPSDKERLESFLAQNSLQGANYRGLLERGQLWNGIERMIGDHSIDLVVLGTHGRHGLTKLVLGSSAEQIFRRASCPVLTVGPEAALAREEQTRSGCILFATDFSSGSLHALPYALSMAEESQARLILLHATPLGSSEKQASMEGHARNRLLALIPKDASDWCRPECLVRFEFPAEAILKVADAERADLIVMGVHKKAPVASAHLPWAVAYEVVCHAKCPVLTVRES